MTPGQSIGTCLARYATFSGRASRSEFWWFAGAAVAVVCAGFALDTALFGGSGTAAVDAQPRVPISGLSLLALALPLVAAASRRLRDANLGAWRVAVPVTGVLATLGLLAFGATTEDPFAPVPDQAPPLSASFRWGAVVAVAAFVSVFLFVESFPECLHELFETAQRLDLDVGLIECLARHNGANFELTIAYLADLDAIFQRLVGFAEFELIQNTARQQIGVANRLDTHLA